MGRTSTFVATLSPYSYEDMEILDAIRKTVSTINKASVKKYRVCVRGRKPFEKKVVRNKWSGRTSLVSYDAAGNVVGGIQNAQRYDVYIYRRYD